MGRRHRGEGALFQRADGMWLGTVDLGIGGDGKRRRRTVSSRDHSTAVSKLRVLRRQIEDGTLATTSNTTVTAWLTRWLEEIARPRLKPKTLASNRSAITRHLIPLIGAYRLDKLTPAHVRSMHKALAGPPHNLSPASILRTHRVLAKALTDAQREGLVVRNVATLVDAPRKSESDRGALTTAQAVQLLRTADATDDPMASRWAAALLLGARQGELLGLTWDRVDLHAGTADLAWQLQEIPLRHGCGGTCWYTRAGYCPQREFDVEPGLDLHPLVGNMALIRPKSRAGRRLIPLPVPLVAVLARHHQQARANTDRLVWTDEGGKPIRPKADLAAWHEALTRAGLPKVTLHAARHSTATLLLEAGVDQNIIASIMGHSSIVATQGYLHADRSMQRTALAALNGLLPGPAGQAP